MNTQLPNVDSSFDTNHQGEPAVSQTQPDLSMPIQWAKDPALDPSLAAKLQACRNRNWINEELITFSCKHWNCSREEAVAKLLGARDEASQ